MQPYPCGMQSLPQPTKADAQTPAFVGCGEPLRAPHALREERGLSELVELFIVVQKILGSVVEVLRVLAHVGGAFGVRVEQILQYGGVHFIHVFVGFADVAIAVFHKAHRGFGFPAEELHFIPFGVRIEEVPPHRVVAVGDSGEGKMSGWPHGRPSTPGCSLPAATRPGA